MEGRRARNELDVFEYVVCVSKAKCDGLRISHTHSLSTLEYCTFMIRCLYLVAATSFVGCPITDLYYGIFAVDVIDVTCLSCLVGDASPETCCAVGVSQCCGNASSDPSL